MLGNDDAVIVFMDDEFLVGEKLNINAQTWIVIKDQKVKYQRGHYDKVNKLIEKGKQAKLLKESDEEEELDSSACYARIYWHCMDKVIYSSMIKVEDGVE